MDSVDILVLNKDFSSFLPTALDSCIRQTYPNINIIIVDDGSTDNSKNIILEYAKNNPNIKYFFSDITRGISSTRNKLIEMSTSNYVAFLSSDDYFDKNFIEEYYNILKDTDKNIGGIYGSFDWVAENGEKIGRLKKAISYTHEQLLEYLKNWNGECIVTFESSLFKKEIFNSGVIFREEIQVGEENLFIAELLEKFHFIAEPNKILAFKREHTSSGHKTKKNIWWAEIRKIKEILKK